MLWLVLLVVLRCLKVGVVACVDDDALFWCLLIVALLLGAGCLGCG